MKQYFAIPNTIDAKEIKKIRNKMNLTQVQFAQLVNCNKRTIENWEVKEESIKGPIVTLVKLLEMYPEVCEKLTIPEQKKPLRLIYMYKNDVCTIIDVDERNKKIEFKNFKEDPIYRAFGIKENVSYEEYEMFLESRCFPKERDKMKIILKELDLPFYDPIMIIEKSQGRMAEDDFWINIERKRA